MCGIIGTPRITPSVQLMLPYLGIRMEERGRDSWGCASSAGEYFKHGGPLTKSWHEARERVAAWADGIFHCRGASPSSQGDRQSADLAHPFSFSAPDGTSVVGVHNGYISNWKELNTKLNRNFPVDSMHIWAHRSEGRSWKEIEGWGNLLWWESFDGVRKLNFTRFNTDALEVAQLEGGEYVLCSLQDPVRVIAQMFGNPVKNFLQVKEKHHYWFEPHDDGTFQLVCSEKPLEFGVPATSAGHIYGVHQGGQEWRSRGGQSSGSSSNSVGADYPGYCAKCSYVRVHKGILCHNCLRQLVESFKRTQAAG